VVFKQAQRLTERFSARYREVVGRARKGSSVFDHYWRTKDRYGEVLGGRLSAAIAYYGFFAVFALAMVVYTVVLKLFSADENIVAQVDAFLSKYFVQLNTETLRANADNLQTVGLISLVLAGIGWVDAWRSSLRAVWRLDQHPGNFLVLRVVDFGTLIVFALLMIISIGATDGLAWLFRAIAHGADQTTSFKLASSSLTFLINVTISFGLLSILPRVHLTWSRLVGPMLAVAIGLTVLNGLGRFLFLRTERNPAYAIVATSVGLLVYLYTFNQIVIWATSWAATSSHGKVFDLAWGKPREHDTLDEAELPNAEGQ
jgi:membrane protein